MGKQKNAKKKNYVLTDISATPILHVLEVVQARKATNSIVISHFGKIMLQTTPILTLSNKHGYDRSVMSKSIKFLPP